MSLSQLPNGVVTNGVFVCTSTTRPASPTEGLTIYETDTDYYKGYSGTAWEDGLKLGAWVDWTPTLTNLTLGNGTLGASYAKVGRTVMYRFRFVLGSTSAVGTSPRFTLPVAPDSGIVANQDVMGDVNLTDTGTANRRGMALLSSGSTVELFGYSSTGVLVVITDMVPHPWAPGDIINVSGTYEAAS